MITLGVFSESVCNRQQFSVCDYSGGFSESAIDNSFLLVITLGWGGRCVSESVCSRQQLSVCHDTKGDLWLFFLLIGKYLCDISACQSYLWWHLHWFLCLLAAGVQWPWKVYLQQVLLWCSVHRSYLWWLPSKYISPTCGDCPVSTSVLPVAIAQ